MPKKTHEEKIAKLEEEIMKECEKVKKEADEVKFCPKCESEEIGVEVAALNPIDYCKTCGFNSIKKGMVEVMHFPSKIKEGEKM